MGLLWVPRSRSFGDVDNWRSCSYKYVYSLVSDFNLSLKLHFPNSFVVESAERKSFDACRTSDRSTCSTFFWSMDQPCQYSSCWCYVISNCGVSPLLWCGSFNISTSFSGMYIGSAFCLPMLGQAVANCQLAPPPPATTFFPPSLPLFWLKV
jgi:hypothetical protein